MKQTSFKRWLSLLRPQLSAFLGGLLCVIVVTAAELTVPLIFGRGIIDDTLVGAGDPKMLTMFATGALVLFAVKGLFAYGQVYFTSYVGNRTLHNLRSSLFSHIIRLPVSFFTKQGNGDVISRATNDIAVIQNTVASGIAEAVRNVLLIVGITFLIFWVNWKLALVTCLVLPLAALAITVFGRRIRVQSGKLNERIGDLTALLNETLRGIRIVKAFTMEKTQKARFTKQNESGFEASMKSVRATATMTPVVEWLLVCSMVIIIWFGGMQVLSGQLSLGDLIAFLAYVGMITQPITSLTRISVMFQQAAAASSRIFQILEAEPERQNGDKANQLPAIKGHIRFRDLSFEYEPGQPVLHNVNLEIKPGETVALVGPSGAGKSTMAGLIPRFFDPTEGSVEVDGYDVRDVTFESLRSQIGLVSQDTILFEVSVRDNIVAGRSGYTDEDVMRAAQVANAHEFIMELPQGYDTIIGEGGSTLSGGQRQRLAIARALLGNPRILLLDEATSSLDPVSEQLIKDAFQRMSVGRTTIIIAHRAATIEAADRVVVVSDGKVVQQGRHHELQAVDGVYRNLFGALAGDMQWERAAASNT